MGAGISWLSDLAWAKREIRILILGLDSASFNEISNVINKQFTDLYKSWPECKIPQTQFNKWVEKSGVLTDHAVVFLTDLQKATAYRMMRHVEACLTIVLRFMPTFNNIEERGQFMQETLKDLVD